METLIAWKNRIALSGTALKLLAMLCMTVDHMGLLLLDNFWLCRVIGRLAFPIFAYMIAEGCRYTRHKSRYLLILLGEGLLCSAVYYLAQRSLAQNILITFSLSVLLIFGLFDLKKQAEQTGNLPRLLLSLFWVLGTLAVTFFLGFPPSFLREAGFSLDYGVVGVLCPVIVAILPDRRSRWLGLAAALVLLAFSMGGGRQWFGLLALIPLFFYSGKRGKYSLNYLFYVYYPLHLLVLEGIRSLVHSGG